jgi:putative hydrolase of the HAD superfamily
VIVIYLTPYASVFRFTVNPTLRRPWRIFDDMHKKALILDLDNTIYPVSSIGDTLFAPLFDVIKKDEQVAGKFADIRSEVMRRPFQMVAKEFHFSKELTERGIQIMKDIAYNGKIIPFEDYKFVRELPVDKFLVTAGFLKMQQSKVEAMQLQRDFKEIHIIDFTTTKKVKKDVFAEIVAQHHFDKRDVLIVGDDLYSEIKAAQELGIDAVLYDKLQLYKEEKSVIKITDFAELKNYL